MVRGFFKHFEQGVLGFYTEGYPYWANSGMHLLNKNIDFPEKGSREHDVLPKLALQGKLKAFKHTGHWVTINTMKELEEAGEVLKKLGM